MESVDKTKWFVIAGVVAVLVIVLMLVRLLTGNDALQPQFRDALIAQYTIVEMSNIAVERANSPELRNRASVISGTIGSDFSSLRPYYENAYGALPKQNSEQQFIDDLDGTHEGFDELYQESILDYLLISRNGLQALQVQENSQEFEDILEAALRNHQSHIDALTNI